MHNKNAFKKGIIGYRLIESMLDVVNIYIFELNRSGTENVEGGYSSIYDDSEKNIFLILNTSDKDEIDPMRKKRKRTLVYN